MRMFLMMLVLVVGVVLTVPAESGVSLKVTLGDTRLNVYEGDAPVLQYKYRQVPRKPYVLSWFTPKGVNILRDAPDDHLHHHGLMHAITVEDINFWEETEQGGYQKHHAFTGVRVDPGLAAFTQTLHWHGPDSPDTLLVEQRSLVHHKTGDSPVRMLTWHSILEAPDNRDEVILGGRIYHGIGMRFPAFMDRVGAFRFADDVSGGFEDGAHYLANAAWCAYTVENEGHAVTVAMFSTPANPRPTLWFTMREPFTYLSATLDLSREPLLLETDTPLIMKYGLAAWDGVVDDDTIGVLYEEWLKMTHETIRI